MNKRLSQQPPEPVKMWKVHKRFEYEECDDFEEVCKDLEENGWAKGKKLHLEHDKIYSAMNLHIDDPFFWIPQSMTIETKICNNEVTKVSWDT